MLRFIVRRLLLLVPILLGLSILLFAWLRNLPGGPAEALLGERATPERIARSTTRTGSTSRSEVQYWLYLKRVGSTWTWAIRPDRAAGASTSSTGGSRPPSS